MDKYNAEGYKDLTAYEALRNIEKEEEQFSRLKLIYVCSPFAGNVEYNTSRAKGYSRYVMSKGFIPLAHHLLLPQFLDDEDKEEREMGLTYALFLLGKCDAIWVFGRKITNGMQGEIKRAKRYGIPIKYFNEGCEEVFK